MFASISMTDATDDGFTGGGHAAALLTEESEAAEEAEAPAPLLCQSCRKAALRAHETPDEGYDCDACGAAPTHWLCSGGCDDYEICNTCYEQLVAEGAAAAAAAAAADNSSAAVAAAPSITAAWSWRNDDEWTDYSAEDNEVIERAHSEGLKLVTLPSGIHQVDLREYLQRRLDDRNRKRPVRRQEISASGALATGVVGGAGAGGRGQPSARVRNFFIDKIVEFRRARQIADPVRTSRTRPQFCDGGVEAERRDVENSLFQRWQQEGWDIATAIQLIWSGVTDISVLTQGIEGDSDSIALIGLILKADNEEYRAEHEAACRARQLSCWDKDKPAKAPWTPDDECAAATGTIYLC